MSLCFVFFFPDRVLLFGVKNAEKEMLPNELLKPETETIRVRVNSLYSRSDTHRYVNQALYHLKLHTCQTLNHKTTQDVPNAM